MCVETLQNLLDSCDAQKADILARVDAMTETTRTTQPKPGEWSPHEIIAHLVVADEWAVGQIEAARKAGGGLGRPGIKGALFVKLIAGPLRSGSRRLPAPRATLPDPLAGLPLPVLADRWETARQAVRTRIGQVTPENEKNAVALHPLAGPLNALQFLTITDAHLTYHKKQLARLAVSPSAA